MNKRKEDALKKTKKKPVKGEEENSNDFTQAFSRAVTEKLLVVAESIPIISLASTLRETALKANFLYKPYLSWLSRLTSVQMVRDSRVDGRNVVVRIDLEEYELKEEEIDEELEIEEGHEKKISYDFAPQKDKSVKTMQFVLDNRCKTMLLLCENGPKDGVEREKYSMRGFEDYCITVDF